MSDKPYKIGGIEREPVMCSQGGVPYNKPHLDAKDAEIERLSAENERLLTELNESERQTRAQLKRVAQLQRRINDGVD